jgi:hypothetical protein
MPVADENSRSARLFQKSTGISLIKVNHEIFIQGEVSELRLQGEFNPEIGIASFVMLIVSFPFESSGTLESRCLVARNRVNLNLRFHSQLKNSVLL